jgi:hypothetical protein
MRVLIARDDGQLQKLESAIADFNSRSQAERDRFSALVAALEEERDQIRRVSSHR